ncbi:hypothetical protein L6452_27025 [Arctium lappa]|uniref:Uncharacterized protein n=1 Tax=Arctium lappa TaxID=4217 RepID=A0ACB8ZWI0_ARCLA|nr:hypothetical protein L6452_27025 [Arctium lappa]
MGVRANLRLLSTNFFFQAPSSHVVRVGPGPNSRPILLAFSASPSSPVTNPVSDFTDRNHVPGFKLSSSGGLVWSGLLLLCLSQSNLSLSDLWHSFDLAPAKSYILMPACMRSEAHPPFYNSVGASLPLLVSGLFCCFSAPSLATSPLLLLSSIAASATDSFFPCYQQKSCSNRTGEDAFYLKLLVVQITSANPDQLQKEACLFCHLPIRSCKISLGALLTKFLLLNPSTTYSMKCLREMYYSVDGTVSSLAVE